MNTSKPVERSSVILAANVGSHSIRMVSLAVQMAASTNSQLRGLFVLDEDLLRLTALPVTREISLTSARERPTDTQQMRRALHVAAKEFKKILQQQAGALSITWSFDTVHGKMRDIGLKPDTDVAYTILGQPASRYLASKPERRQRRVLLVANESRHQQHALEVVMTQFDHENVELTLVSSDDNHELADAIRRMGEVKSGRVRLVQLNPEEMLEILPGSGLVFDYAILSQHESAEYLLRILKQLSCPVILTA